MSCPRRHDFESVHQLLHPKWLQQSVSSFRRETRASSGDTWSIKMTECVWLRLFCSVFDLHLLSQRKGGRIWATKKRHFWLWRKKRERRDILSLRAAQALFGSPKSEEEKEGARNDRATIINTDSLSARLTTQSVESVNGCGGLGGPDNRRTGPAAGLPGGLPGGRPGQQADRQPPGVCLNVQCESAKRISSVERKEGGFVRALFCSSLRH